MPLYNIKMRLASAKPKIWRLVADSDRQLHLRQLLVEHRSLKIIGLDMFRSEIFLEGLQWELRQILCQDLKPEIHLLRDVRYIEIAFFVYLRKYG